MIYLDYSATTQVSEDVLDTYIKCCISYPGNPNSLHRLGFESSKLIDEATNQIATILKVKPNEIIYTSGASESNNMALKGIAKMYQNRGKHIITTNLEHSSIYGPLAFLQNQGFEIDFVNLDKDGMVDLDHLEKLLRDDTILVSIAAVNSEIGLRQPIEAIGKILKKYPKCFFHSDLTQSIGKVDIDISDVDLVSFSAHKFFGMKGVGVLIKKENVNIEPLIHGGKSTTKFRSGTPATPLIVSTSKALRLATSNLDRKYEYVKGLWFYLKDELSKISNVVINSNNECIPHILNFSVLGIKPETMLHALEEKEIYISTQSACSDNTSKSRSVFALTNDDNVSLHSLRISISYLTTKEEIDTFIEFFKQKNNELLMK